MTSLPNTALHFSGQSVFLSQLYQFLYQYRNNSQIHRHTHIHIYICDFISAFINFSNNENDFFSPTQIWPLCSHMIHMSSFRSLSELEGVRLEGQTSEKIRQVTERATLFRITSNAMINVRQPGNIFALGKKAVHFIIHL